MRTNCERQLGLSLYSDGELKADSCSVDSLGLPHRQLRPGLQQMTSAGDDWQEKKNADLLQVFGKEALRGNQTGAPVFDDDGSVVSVKFTESDLASHVPGVAVGQFILEAGFSPTATFMSQFDLDQWMPSLSMDVASVRPDVLEAGDADRFPSVVDHRGNVYIDTNPDLIRLRVIDVKLTSTPGPGNFVELAYYSLVLAAWIEDSNLGSRFAVASQAAVWGGSYTVPHVRSAHEHGVGGRALFEALDADMETVPLDVFIPVIEKLLVETLPHVAAKAAGRKWKTDLGWHVQSACSSCDYLGQSFNNPPLKPGSASAQHENHCVPQAEAGDHLCRLPFVSLGGARSLRGNSIETVTAVSLTPSSAAAFDDHHSLRAGRDIVPRRASTLIGDQRSGLMEGEVATATIPRPADLSLYVTADFDQSSAITLAFGLSGLFAPNRFGPAAEEPVVPLPSKAMYVPERSVDAERQMFAQFLTAIRQAMDNAVGMDPDATVQVYMWDRLTYDHLVRVAGRHLGWLLAEDDLSQLAWLFPPDDQMVTGAHLVRTPPISIVGDAVKSLVLTDEPHACTLLGTAARYHGDKFRSQFVSSPSYWTSQFSDQIPTERAFDLWAGNPSIPHDKLLDNLSWTVKSKLSALNEVTRKIQADIGYGNLLRKPPAIGSLTGPTISTTSSMLGNVAVSYSQMNAATDHVEKAHMRALSVTEREARFGAIVGNRKIVGPERDAAVEALGLNSSDSDYVMYETNVNSSEAKMKPGDFLLAVSPASSVGLLDRSPYNDLKEHGLLNAHWYSHWDRTFADLLGVELVMFDRRRCRMILRLDKTIAVKGLTRAGIIDLDGPVVVDQVAADFTSFRIRQAAAAIGNPAKAAIEHAELAASLGLSAAANPSVRSSPAEDLLWEPTLLQQATVDRDALALREQMRARFRETGDHNLNGPQWDAFHHALTRRLTLIWGPPGTGKTQTLRTILGSFGEDMARRSTGENVLLTGATWSAIDNVAEELCQRSFTIFRPVSTGQPSPDWGTPVDFQDPDDREALHYALRGPTPTLIAATCQQAQKVIQVFNDHEQWRDAPAGAEVFDVVAIDEAGQLDVGLSLLAFAGIKPDSQTIIAGDPLQLAPVHQVEPPDTLRHHVGPVYNYFRDLREVPECTLTVNYRSNKEIVRLARFADYPAEYTAFFPDQRMPSAGNVDNRPLRWPDQLEWNPLFADICDPEAPIVCITHPEGMSGQWNQFEADLTAGIVSVLEHHLGTHADSDSPKWMWEHGIGVVTPHRAQRALISNLLQSSRPADIGTFVDSAVDTVERFQGRERHAIVASFAVGDPDTIAGEADFIQNLNRFNVLATRAKSKLVVIVSEEVIDHISVDLPTIRASRLIKAFASTYCSEADEHLVRHDSGNRKITVRYPPAH